jgi:phosphohistidine swiveling domain-containing protein
MIQKDIERALRAKNWYKIWAGNWSLLSCTHFAEQYTDILDLEGVKFAKNCALVYRDGACFGFMPEDEKVKFGAYIADIYTKDQSKIDTLISYFKEQADMTVAYVAAERGKRFDLKRYEDFWKRIDTYYVPHIINKWMVESLDPAILQKHLHGLQEARIHAEPVFKRTEELMHDIASQIAGETGKTADLVLSCTKAEILSYWKGTKLPDDSVLAERRKYSAILHMPGVRELYTGNDAHAIEELMAPKQEKNQAGVIKGTTAYPGKVRGVVKIILDPTKGDHFNEGDILVTGMTRPEYLALMQKAGAFVTDSGGILSHAAIVARELKKPCVIGTQVATKVLKDGDMVEVDADKGVVRILK